MISEKNKLLNCCTDTVLMVLPKYFTANTQTQLDNSFQDKTSPLTAEVSLKAKEEFDTLVEKMEHQGITVIKADEAFLTPQAPDAIFPNNWISFHNPDKYILYPMLAQNRRQERNHKIIAQVYQKIKKPQEKIKCVDLSSYESKSQFLEGTGSMVLDRYNGICYANFSKRTSKTLLDLFCKQENYEGCFFHAYYQEGSEEQIEIYHTNVMLSIGNDYAIICIESIPNGERERVYSKLKTYKKDVITISESQMLDFAANSIQLRNKKNDLYIIMSSRAYSSFTKQQLSTLSTYGKIIHSDLSTIENLGGGGARCMICEVFS